MSWAKHAGAQPAGARARTHAGAQEEVGLLAKKQPGLQGTGSRDGALGLSTSGQPIESQEQAVRAVWRQRGQELCRCWHRLCRAQVELSPLD